MYCVPQIAGTSYAVGMISMVSVPKVISLFIFDEKLEYLGIICIYYAQRIISIEIICENENDPSRTRIHDL